MTLSDTWTVFSIIPGHPPDASICRQVQDQVWPPGRSVDLLESVWKPSVRLLDVYSSYNVPPC
jgi:hypothetical protein